MRKSLLPRRAFLGGALGLFAVRGASALEKGALPLSPEVAVQIGRISDWLNGFIHLEGEFRQTDPSGSVRAGKFYIRRPWRMRFVYDPPSELVVVADGNWLAIRESKDQPVQRYPISSTPARFFLAPNINLTEQARILGFAANAQEMRVVLADRDREVPGSLALHFSTQPLSLLSWSVRGAEGRQTRVDLRNLRRGIKARNEFFRLDD